MVTKNSSPILYDPIVQLFFTIVYQSSLELGDLHYCDL